VSFPALGWASTVKVERASDKLVLLALADRHNTEHDLAYPSLAWLVEFTSLDRKTIVASLDRLEADGFIADSGQRVGKTKQVKAYILHWNSPEKGMVKAEPLAANSPVFPGKQSQKRNPEPVKEPAQAKACYLKGIGLPEWIPAEPWQAYVRMRKAKDKGFTEDAARGAIREANKLRGQGYDPAKLLWKAVDKGWKGIYAHDDCKAVVALKVAPEDFAERAKFFDSIGQPDKAAEYRRRATSIGQIANDLQRQARAS
jgi:hypothetical protein